MARCDVKSAKQASLGWAKLQQQRQQRKTERAAAPTAAAGTLMLLGGGSVPAAADQDCAWPHILHGMQRRQPRAPRRERPASVAASAHSQQPPCCATDGRAQLAPQLTWHVARPPSVSHHSVLPPSVCCRHSSPPHLQLESLDLVNCIIAPVFFANALALWDRGLLSAVYCVVLLLKGYQMGLLLLPNARRQHAHTRARCVRGHAGMAGTLVHASWPRHACTD